MAARVVELEGIGIVSLFKRRGVRSIRISLTHDGKVRVTLPYWATYGSALAFIETRRDWILQERPKIDQIVQNQRIGKAHHISFELSSGTTPSSRISGTQIRILLPAGISWSSEIAQTTARSAAIKALKKEARMLLPRRLETLAEQYGFEYSDVSIKQLKGRWGSCDQNKRITFNCFLMQLPWDLIDYVIIHELAHTRIMAHGPRFWAVIDSVLPDGKQLRTRIKLHKPVV